MTARQAAWAVFGACIALATAATADERAVAWDEAFSTKAAPATVHFHATYKDARGGQHALEVWRDGARILRRKTDEALDLVVERRDKEYAYRLVDHVNKRVVRVTRTNLYRIGTFSDWSSLSGMLARPDGPFTLAPAAAAAEATPIGACRTFRVARRGAAADEVCWSAAWGVPLRIRRADAAGRMQTVFAIDLIEKKLAGPSVFQVPSDGMIEVRADDDIAPSGGD